MLQSDPHARRLAGNLAGYDHLLIAFSGGVDSTLLLAEAVRALGVGRVLALTALSPTLSEVERQESESLAVRIGARHLLRESGEMEDPRFVQNGPRRCYYCKSALFEMARQVVEEQPEPQRWQMAYGANRDDLGDDRPGMVAAQEAGAVAPLLDVGLGKLEIRKLSRLHGLPTADKPAFACLSSRFPTHTAITLVGLKRVEAAEMVLRNNGFRQYRVRDYGGLARVELGRDELGRLDHVGLKARIIQGVLAAGFEKVTLDPDGYRMGGAAPEKISVQLPLSGSKSS
ncbi:MAG: ATP-dependent sacrificial sulfur transferase LarE [Magnetococcales bacterium]|nr:ATP-dependent sacrificial sulfur transferase LarE [Magnetococcales bacterium]